MGSSAPSSVISTAVSAFSLFNARLEAFCSRPKNLSIPRASFVVVVVVGGDVDFGTGGAVVDLAFFNRSKKDSILSASSVVEDVVVVVVMVVDTVVVVLVVAVDDVVMEEGCVVVLMVAIVVVPIGMTFIEMFSCVDFLSSIKVLLAS